MLVCSVCYSPLSGDRERCARCGATRPDTGWVREAWCGTVLMGRYEVVRRIGAGATGAAYQARDRRATVGDPRSVVVKFLHGRQARDPDVVARFRVEALAGALVQHPGVAGTVAFAEGNRVGVLVREFVRGRSLTARMREDGAFTIDEAIDCALGVARALAACHAQGVVHRDVKPQNIYLEEDTFGGERPRLIDFGFALVQRPGGVVLGATKPGTIVGSPAYMAPEQTRSTAPLDGRADLYALGVVLYRMLAGERPLRARTVPEQVRLHRTVKPVPLRKAAPGRGISRTLEAIVMKLLEKDPARRFQKADQVIHALAAARPKPAISEPRPATAGDRRPPAEVSQSGLFALPRLEALKALRNM